MAARVGGGRRGFKSKAPPYKVDYPYPGVSKEKPEKIERFKLDDLRPLMEYRPLRDGEVVFDDPLMKLIDEDFDAWVEKASAQLWGSSSFLGRVSIAYIDPVRAVGNCPNCGLPWAMIAEHGLECEPAKTIDGEAVDVTPAGLLEAPK